MNPSKEELYILYHQTYTYISNTHLRTLWHAHTFQTHTYEHYGIHIHFKHTHTNTMAYTHISNTHIRTLWHTHTFQTHTYEQYDIHTHFKHTHTNTPTQPPSTPAPKHSVGWEERWQGRVKGVGGVRYESAQQKLWFPNEGDHADL